MKFLESSIFLCIFALTLIGCSSTTEPIALTPTSPPSFSSTMIPTNPSVLTKPPTKIIPTQTLLPTLTPTGQPTSITSIPSEGNIIIFGKVYSSNLNNSPSGDLYKVTFEEEGDYEILVSSVPECELKLSIYDNDQNELISWDLAKLPRNSPIHIEANEYDILSKTDQLNVFIDSSGNYYVLLNSNQSCSRNFYQFKIIPSDSINISQTSNQEPIIELMISNPQNSQSLNQGWNLVASRSNFLSDLYSIGDISPGKVTIVLEGFLPEDDNEESIQISLFNEKGIMQDFTIWQPSQVFSSEIPEQGTYFIEIFHQGKTNYNPYYIFVDIHE